MEKIIEVEKRKFGIYEYGIESEPVIFYFHGFPSSILDGGLTLNQLHQKFTNGMALTIKMFI